MVALLKIRMGLAIGLVALVSLMGVSVASAQEPDGAPGGGPGGKVPAEALENFYQRAKLQTEMFQLRLDLSNKMTGRIQELIDKAKAEGKDTASLESALAALKTAISAAQAKHDQAASILSAHAGFDGSGKVTDEDQARETLRSAREVLREGQHTLRQGLRQFRHVFREWRMKNKPSSQP